LRGTRCRSRIALAMVGFSARSWRELGMRRSWRVAAVRGVCGALVCAVVFGVVVV
jgi:hypothetical protein